MYSTLLDCLFRDELKHRVGSRPLLLSTSTEHIKLDTMFLVLGPHRMPHRGLVRGLVRGSDCRSARRSRCRRVWCGHCSRLVGGPIRWCGWACS
jgi:hypothetical protein